MQVELKKNTAWHEESEEKKNNPQTMLLGEYSVRTGKTPQQHKSTYTMTHDIATGEVNPAQQAAIWSRSL